MGMIIPTYKKHKEEMEEIRAINTDVLKTTLDDLIDPKFTEDQRKQLAESAKRLLDSNADVERSDGELMYSLGQCSGLWRTIGSILLGGAIGRGIGYILQKVSTK
jgi:hypothetical protein